MDPGLLQGAHDLLGIVFTQRERGTENEQRCDIGESIVKGQFRFGFGEDSALIVHQGHGLDHTADVTEAAGAALYDDIHQTWASNRLALTGLDRSVLPAIRPAGAEVGPLLPNVAHALGLSTETKVIVGAGEVIVAGHARRSDHVATQFIAVALSAPAPRDFAT